MKNYREAMNAGGGPAFPISIPGCGDNGWGGMTLRDYFAAQALTGVLVAEGAQYFGRPEQIATTAYAMADAMMAARIVSNNKGTEA